MQTKTALITGATSGIGYEIAIILAQKGYDLFIVSRDFDKLSTIKKDLEERFEITVSILALDLSEINTAQIVFDQIQEQGINVEILVNNAGIGLQGEHCNLEVNTVHNMLNLNIITLTELCALFGKMMKLQKKGYILNIASTAAYQPFPYFAAYSASKSYVLNFSEALTKELEDYQVHVTCLSPGVTDTDFFNKMGFDQTNKGFWKNSGRMSARKVAEIGVKALFAHKLSVVPGFKNKFYAFINRFVPRALVAKISKSMSKARL